MCEFSAESDHDAGRGEDSDDEADAEFNACAFRGLQDQQRSLRALLTGFSAAASAAGRTAHFSPGDGERRCVETADEWAAVQCRWAAVQLGDGGASGRRCRWAMGGASVQLGDGEA